LKKLRGALMSACQKHGEIARKSAIDRLCDLWQSPQDRTHPLQGTPGGGGFSGSGWSARLKKKREEKTEAVRSERRVRGERVCGRVMNCVVPGIVLTFLYMAIFVVIPHLDGKTLDTPHPRLKAFSCVLAFLTLWSYAEAAGYQHDPKKRRKSHSKKDPEGTETENAGLLDPEIGFTGGLRLEWCNDCGRPKPARAHHCKKCQTCVLRMDHHCIFLGNCVGQGNHRHFYQFCIYIILCTFVYCCLTFGAAFSDATPGERFLLYFLLPGFCVFAGGLVTALTVVQFWDAVNGRTYLERKFNIDVSKYRRSKLGNLVTIFGPSPVYWFLPLRFPTWKRDATLQ